MIDWYIEGIEFDLTDTYGQFNVLRHSGRGVVHS